MKVFARFMVAFFVLWVPFSIAALVAIPVSLFALVFEWEYAKNILRAKDKLAAALLGWSGKYTVSAECGVSDCKACKAVCWLLNFLDPGHCEGAAKKEGI